MIAFDDDVCVCVAMRLCMRTRIDIVVILNILYTNCQSLLNLFLRTERVFVQIYFFFLVVFLICYSYKI